MTRRRPTCQVVDVDGTPVRIRTTGQPLTDQDRAALADLVAAVRRRTDEESTDPEPAGPALCLGCDATDIECLELSGCCDRCHHE